MRSRWKIAILVPCGIFLLGLSGCDPVLRAVGLKTDQTTVRSLEESRSGAAIGTQSLTTEQGNQFLVNEAANIALALPASWSEDDRLHESAELQASDLDQELYMIVVAEADQSLLRLGLAENAEKYRALLIDRLASLESQSATDVAFVGDNFASQYEIRGRLADNTPVVYLHTTVVTENRYYQIVGWTSPEQYQFYKSELQAITETFEETES
jgi:hypothetical protein